MFLNSLEKYPNLLEIFDFLGKGMHENIAINNDINKTKSFKMAKEVFKIEMSIQSITIIIIIDIMESLYQLKEKNQQKSIKELKIAKSLVLNKKLNGNQVIKSELKVMPRAVQTLEDHPPPLKHHSTLTPLHFGH